MHVRKFALFCVLSHSFCWLFMLLLLDTVTTGHSWFKHSLFTLADFHLVYYSNRREYCVKHPLEETVHTFWIFQFILLSTFSPLYAIILNVRTACNSLNEISLPDRKKINHNLNASVEQMNFECPLAACKQMPLNSASKWEYYLKFHNFFLIFKCMIHQK